MKKLIFSLRAAFSGWLLPQFYFHSSLLWITWTGASPERAAAGWEESLRRSCAACYAAEGIYPPDLAYLTSHYGIQIDERLYAVDYRPIAENLMPDITVLEIEP